MTLATVCTCNMIPADVTRAVFNVEYLQVVATGDRYNFHGNVTDVNKVNAKASLDVQCG